MEIPALFLKCGSESYPSSGNRNGSFPVSGKRVSFDFYVSEKMKDVNSVYGSTQKIIDTCLEHYYTALDNGVKPEEARRIIPQAAYTNVWAAFMPMHLDNYFKLRLDSHAQWEIRQTAIAMDSLIKEVEA